MRSGPHRIGRLAGTFAPRWRKVGRDAWHHKARTLLVVLAIAVGIVGAGAVLNTWCLLRRVTRAEYQASNPASATVRADSIDAPLLARVAAMPAIRDVEARRTVIGSARVPAGWQTAVIFAYEDFTAIRIGVVKPESGAWPPPDGALVVEASSVEFAGTAAACSLAVQLPDAASRVLPVAGVARDVGLAPGWMEHVVYLFATRTTLAKLGAPASLDELQIVVVDRGLDRNTVRHIAAQVRSVVESTGRRVTGIDVPVPGRHIHAGQIDSLLFTQGAFGVLAMLSSAILVINLIAAMLSGQVREIGVMKALGASPVQIAGMYLGFALLLGLVASGLALPVAGLVGRMYARITANLLNFDISGARIPLPAILLELAVGALLPVAAAAIPVARGCRIPVSAALRDFGIADAGGRSGRRPRRGRRPRGGLLTRPILMSLRNTFRRRQRLALTLLTLAMGGAVYIGALDLRASIRGSVDLLFDSQRFDVALRFAHAAPAESLESALAGVPGVARAEAWGATRAAAREAWSSSFAISAPPANSRMFAPSFRSGRWPNPGDGNALVVNRRLLEEEPGLVLGDETPLLIQGRTEPWKVIGVVETGPSPAAYTCRETLARVTGETGVDRVVVAAASGGTGSSLVFVQRLRTELERRGYAVQSSHLMAENRRVMEDHLLLVAGFLGVMSQLMIVVGGLGLAASMSLAVLERTREIGVLRAIGARHRAIVGMVQTEGLVVAVLGWALALPLSVPMSIVLGLAFGRIMIPVPVHFVPDPGAVLQWLGIALAVSVAACAWPAYRATRITTAAALAYE